MSVNANKSRHSDKCSPFLRGNNGWESPTKMGEVLTLVLSLNYLIPSSALDGGERCQINAGVGTNSQFFVSAGGL